MDTLISGVEETGVPGAMTPETIYVAPLSLVQATVLDARVSHLVTLINGDTLIDTPPSIGPDRHLKLCMNDICDPQPGLVQPCEDHVSDLVKFALDWDRKAPLLIHCWAGISRSTAAAFISLCALNPRAEEAELAWALRRASPTAYPNRRLVALADEALARKGRMMEAVEEIGRGEFAEEAKVFSLPALLAA
ncbi:MAG: tyrosine phosphatase family protein [Methyloceanibacter sp.]